jgi:hypothetical protein
MQRTPGGRFGFRSVSAELPRDALKLWDNPRLLASLRKQTTIFAKGEGLP